MTHVVENERYKYLATWFNNTSVACFVVGFITPGVQLSSGSPSNSAYSAEALAPTLSMIGWFVAAGILHGMARFALGRLRE